MNRRTLGRTGISVSELAFGCVEIGIPYGIGVRSEADMLAEPDAVALLRTALDTGVNLFDTAPAYGRSERLLGKAFRGRRQRVVIATKLRYGLLRKDGTPLPLPELRAFVDESLRASLSALQTDYVDVLQVHESAEPLLENDDLTHVLGECKQRGLVRAVGISTYGPENTRRAIASGRWDVVQLALNLMDQRNADLLPIAECDHIGILVRSVLFKGILTSRGDELHAALRPVAEHRQRYLTLLSRRAPTLAALATKFVLSFPQVGSVLLGIDRLEYLDEALRMADGQYFHAGEVAHLRTLAYPDPEFLDLPTWDRRGWLT